MSTSFYMYAAKKTDGRLVCINPRINDGKEDIIVPTYKSWSRSYFGESSEKLEELGMRINHEDLPEELKDKFKFCEKEPSLPVYEIAVDDLRACFPKDQRHEFHGIYTKDRIFAFESGDVETLFDDDISPEKYVKLDDKYRQKYAYYEWDDPYGWFVNLKQVLDHLEWQIYDWESCTHEQDGKYSLILIIV